MRVPRFPRRIWPGLALLAWLAAACTLQPAPPTATPTPTASATPVPPTATPTLTPSPTTPCFAARADAPQAQGTAVAGQAWQHTWRLENIGACPWPAALQLTALEGSAFPAPKIAPRGETAPGSTLTLPLNLTAPPQAGTYTGRWALQTPKGETITTLSVHLKVIPPSPTPTATPGPPVFREGKIDFVPGTYVNLDNGSNDLVFFASGGQNDELRHVGYHVAFYGPLYFWPPDVADCYHAPYDPKNNALLNLSRYVGLSFCYYTNEKRVGALHVNADYTDGAGQRHLVITYITWAAMLKK